jgi:hypothetical protein
MSTRVVNLAIEDAVKLGPVALLQGVKHVIGVHIEGVMDQIEARAKQTGGNTRINQYTRILTRLEQLNKDVNAIQAALVDLGIGEIGDWEN